MATYTLLLHAKSLTGNPGRLCYTTGNGTVIVIAQAPRLHLIRTGDLNNAPDVPCQDKWHGNVYEAAFQSYLGKTKDIRLLNIALHPKTVPEYRYPIPYHRGNR